MYPYKPDIFESTKDLYSYAEPELARVIDTRLELNVNFRQKVLEGKAILTIEKKNIPEGEDAIFLDNYNLDIIEVINPVTGLPLRYRIGLNNHLWGSSLTIELPQTRFKQCKIEIKYKTSEHSNALVWLPPEQTADGKHPFLLSNNKYTYARAMFPCQDTPSVKSTYSAKITVPSNFTVIMSAILQNVSETRGQATYHFVQMTPIPAYGVVLAVGSLEKAIVDSVSVFAESTYINDSTTFANFESLMQITVDLCGHYFWNKYNICVLPPTISPKYFTIECPNLIFVPPTLLGGGISLDSFLAKKISLMWTEYLVTSVNYDHMWLNKSIGMFIYKKIINRMSIDEKTKEFLKIKVDRKLVKTIEKFMKIGMLQSLIPRLGQNILPNYAMECVPYEVGCMILEQLERKLGGPSVFEQYLKSYFIYFALKKSINTKDWREHFTYYFAGEEKVLKSLDWNEYFFNIEPLGPFSDISNTVTKMTMLETECLNLAEKIENVIYKPLVFLVPSVKSLSEIEKIQFLKYLCRQPFVGADLSVTEKRVMTIVRVIHAQSYEIQFRWLLLCIKNRWTPIFTTALNFAIKFGLSNCAYRIFQELYNWKEMRPLVIETYNRNKERMSCETQVDFESRILGFND